MTNDARVREVIETLYDQAEWCRAQHKEHPELVDKERAEGMARGLELAARIVRDGLGVTKISDWRRESANG